MASHDQSFSSSILLEFYKNIDFVSANLKSQCNCSAPYSLLGPVTLAECLLLSSLNCRQTNERSVPIDRLTAKCLSLSVFRGTPLNLDGRKLCFASPTRVTSNVSMVLTHCGHWSQFVCQPTAACSWTRFSSPIGSRGRRYKGVAQRNASSSLENQNFKPQRKNMKISAILNFVLFTTYSD